MELGFPLSVASPRAMARTRNPLQLLAFLLFSLSLSASATSSSWRSCDSGDSYPVAITDVKISPDPVVRGGDAIFQIPAVASHPISGGSISVQVYYLGVNVHTEKENLCIRTSCPIAPGNFSITNLADLPDFTPTGSYRLDMHIQNENGDLMTCLKINFRVVASSSAQIYY